MTSVAAHALFFVMPTPGAARQARRPDTPLHLTLSAATPEPEAPAAEPAPSPPAPKDPAPSRPPPPQPAMETAPSEPSGPTIAATPDPVPSNLDLDLKPRAGRFAGGTGGGAVGGVRAGGPRLETTPIPKGLEPKGGGGYEYRSRGFTAEIARDGAVTFRGRSNVQHQGSGVAFDLTEAVMGAAGDDAFHPEKVQFLERTAWFRDHLKAQARADDLKEARRRALARVRAIWNGPQPAAERRRLLFSMWDECAESGSEDVVATSRFVRETVEGFIRSQLPPTHPEAFTDLELQALNGGRASQQRFDPYDGADSHDEAFGRQGAGEASESAAVTGE